jgi:asparagine synthase (glutamine-hydrolysing)
VAAANSAAGGARLLAYSCVFPAHADVDEAAEIARVRDWLGLEGVEARFAGGSALSAAAEFLREWELPSTSPNLFVWLPLLRRAAADGVDVMLDGEGGDELFGAARYLVADRLRAGRPLAALRVARALPGMGERPRARWLGRAMMSYGVRAALPPALHERLRRARADGAAGPSWLSEEMDRLHRAGEDPWRWKGARGPRWWAHLAHLLTGAGEALGAPDQMRRAGLMAGVEPRHPLRDPELVELVLSLPPELAFHPRLDRPLARRALAGSLPDATLADERKPAFNSLLESALTGPDAAALRHLLADPHPELAARVRRGAVEQMLKAPTGGSALDLWRIASLEMWLRHQQDPSAERLRALTEAAEPNVSFVVAHGRSRQNAEGHAHGGSVPT